MVTEVNRDRFWPFHRPEGRKGNGHRFFERRQKNDLDARGECWAPPTRRSICRGGFARRVSMITGRPKLIEHEVLTLVFWTTRPMAIALGL